MTGGAVLTASLLAVALLLLGFFWGRRAAPATVHEADARQALEESRDRLATYLDVAGVILLALDTTGRVQLINRKGCELLGASQEELVGSDWFAEYLPEDETARVREIFRSLVAGAVAVPERVENCIRTRTGEIRTIAWRNAVTRDEDGRITGIVSSGEDVTALRASQHALQESLAWQEAAIEGSPDAIFISDADSRFVMVNAAASRLTGYSREELLTMGIADLAVDVTPEWVAETRARILAGEPSLRETAIRRRDGTPVDVEVSSMRVVVEDKLHVHTAARDLTERRLMLRALQESETKYRLLFDEMQEGFALHEMIWGESGEAVDYRFLDVNPAFERLTRLKKEDILGRRVREVLPDIESLWIQRYGDVARTGEPVHFESHARELEQHFRVSAFRPRKNQFAVTFTDVTPRVRAEQALQDSVDQLALAQEVAGIGYMDMDLSTGRGFWSPRTFDFLGLPAAETDTNLETFAAALVPESRTTFLASVEEARQGRVPPPFVYTVATPGGSTTRIAGQSSITSSKDDGKPRLLTVLRDVTHEEAARTVRENLTARLRALAVRLQEVREEERAVLSRELHDGLGQALTGMRMDLSLLRSSLPESRTDLRETIGALIRSTDESVEVVRDISGRLRPPILDVMGLGAAIEWQVEEYAKKAPHRFHVDVSRCPTALPKASAVALFRIAQEALTNVLRHAHAAEVWVGVDTQEGDVVLEVRDNGTGMAPEAGASSSALGLVGMRERALSLGGTVSVDNHPDGGTVVRVRIPWAPRADLERQA